MTHKTALADALKSLSVSDSPSSSDTASTFLSSAAAHPLDFAAFFIGSVLVGMVTFLGVSRLLSPPPSKTASYNAVLDQSSERGAGAGEAVGIELEKPMKKLSPQCQL